MYIKKRSHRLAEYGLAAVQLPKKFTAREIGIPRVAINDFCRTGIIRRKGQVNYVDYRRITQRATLWETTKVYEDLKEHWAKYPVAISDEKKYIFAILQLFNNHHSLTTRDIAWQLGVHSEKIFDSLRWLVNNNELVEVGQNTWMPRLRHFRAGKHDRLANNCGQAQR